MEKTTLLTLLFVSSLFSQNLLVNASFESVTSSSPDNWNLESGNYSIESTTVTDGANSIKVTPISPTPNTLPTSFFSQTFTLSDTDEHTFSFKYYLKGSSLDNEINLISYQFQNVTSSNAFFFTTGAVIESSNFVYNQWVSVTYKIKVLAFRNGATSTDIKFGLRSGSFKFTPSIGTSVLYDDLKIDSNQALGLNNLNNVNLNTIKHIRNKKIFLKSNHNISSYSIYSLIGNTIVNKSKTDTNVINADFLTTGIYIILFRDYNGNIFSKKILIE